MENWQSHIPQTTTPLLRRSWAQALIYSLGFVIYLLILHLPTQSGSSLLASGTLPSTAHPAMTMIYLWLDHNETALGIFTLSVLYIGGYFLFLMHIRLLKDLLWAMALTFLWLSSPTLIHHSVSLQADVPVLCMNLAGIFFFLSYDKDRKFWRLGLSALCFTIGGLLLPVAAIVPAAILALLTWERGLGLRIRARTVVFPDSGWKYLLLAVIPIALILLTAPPLSSAQYPIWQMTLEEIRGTGADLTSFWWHQLLPGAAWIVLAGVLVLAISAREHIDRGMKMLLLTLILLSGAYLSLIFSGLRELDNLLLHFLPLLILLSLLGLEASRWRFPSLFTPRKIQPYKVVLVCICILAMYQARQNLKQRNLLWSTTETHELHQQTWITASKNN